MERVDILVIGGGINGCGIARDAAGRGYSVMLAEQNDLASGTSSASTKLIHGGLRYLEHYEFRLVREALIEREVLLRMAPHIAWPLRFVLPHHKGLRPAWLLRLGLFLYDNLGGRKLLAGTRSVDLRRDAVGGPLSEAYTRAFEYSDCWVEDSRLVVLNAMDAQARGATILTRTKVAKVERAGDVWRATLESAGEARQVEARVVVNAGGPWVQKVLTGAMGDNGPSKVRLVQGSHIVVPRLFDHDKAYIFQNSDGRIVFAIPYERDFTLVGTTDRDWKEDPGKVEISPEEIDYLCRAVSDYLAKPVTPDMVVWTYSGLRPLYDDGSAEAQKATRDYTLTLSGGRGEPALLNVFGGKITTFRKLAESALAKIATVLPKPGAAPWTEGATLPGGDFAVQETGALMDRLAADYPFLEPKTAKRLVRAYGTNAWAALGEAKTAGDLGRDFGAGLTEAEVGYLMRAEFARTAEDVLWRRSKLGLRLTAEQAADLERWMAAHRSDPLRRAA